MKSFIERKFKRMVNKDMNRISRTAKEIAKMWDVKTIPLATLKVMIDKSKPKETTDPLFDEFIIQFNKSLDSLYIACCAIAKKMNSKNIPLTELNNGLRIIRNAY